MAEVPGEGEVQVEKADLDPSATTAETAVAEGVAGKIEAVRPIEGEALATAVASISDRLDPGAQLC
ncbi:hypothetical protein COY05_00835 [Candidatus Peregrinibacteria bacterium CG_4_10_14_0_2_um_filter_38_24]|nr:MAG: hypothetical protein COY05_00835 [Candidatus Peregrinibacteria bacterium CG_4_10_14_0_2_um_filter_38_24]PJC38875.1 MAG: hypothetical protein CO044_02730 [Candidatus Peregrinibacteria bacterium CG_4_9_14_0_2_um_filter_38_9]